MNTVKKQLRVLFFMLALIAMVSAFMPVPAAQASVEAKRYLGEVVNAGHDTGYSRNEKITEDDPHF